MWQLCPDHAGAASKGGPGGEAEGGGGEEEEWARLDHPQPRHQRREARPDEQRPRQHEQDDEQEVQPSFGPCDETEEEVPCHLSVEAPVRDMIKFVILEGLVCLLVGLSRHF